MLQLHYFFSHFISQLPLFQDPHDICKYQGFDQDFRIGCPKILMWGEFNISNSFSSHCIIHKKYGY